MKKAAYIQPKAETVLIPADDVIRASLTQITAETPIGDSGIPKATW